MKIEKETDKESKKKMLEKERKNTDKEREIYS